MAELASQVEHKRIPSYLCRAYHILQLPVTRERLIKRVSGYSPRVNYGIEIKTALWARLVRIGVDCTVQENIARSRNRSDPPPQKLVLYGQAIGTYLGLFKVLVLDMDRRDCRGRLCCPERIGKAGSNQGNRHRGRVVQGALA